VWTPFSSNVSSGNGLCTLTGSHEVNVFDKIFLSMALEILLNNLFHSPKEVRFFYYLGEHVVQVGQQAPKNMRSRTGTSSNSFERLPGTLQYRYITAQQNRVNHRSREVRRTKPPLLWRRVKLDATFTTRYV
jgi:hypothetical protein